MQFWGGPKKEHHTPQAPLTNCPAARPRPPRPARPSASRPSPPRAPRVLPEGHSTARSPPRGWKNETQTLLGPREHSTCRARVFIGREQHKTSAAERVSYEDTRQAGGPANRPSSAWTNHLAYRWPQPPPPPLATPHPLARGGQGPRDGPSRSARAGPPVSHTTEGLFYGVNPVTLLASLKLNGFPWSADAYLFFSSSLNRAFLGEGFLTHLSH